MRTGIPAPSFKGLEPASPDSSRAKQNNPKKGTRHEELLCAELRRRGLRFRRHVTALPGAPDIVFPKKKLAVFCDGDFWHGRNWKSLRDNLKRGTNAEYWTAKISGNIGRDRRNNLQLRKAGWVVIRFWETDIRQNPERIAALVVQTLEASEE